MEQDDDDDDFDKLSSTSILSDIEILNDSIEDNNRELLAWCRRLHINDITNHITVEPRPEQLPIVDVKTEPVDRFQSGMFEHWEKRYSSAAPPPVQKESFVYKHSSPNVPKLLPNYTSEVDKSIWLK